jgi:hypothetical protein
MKYKGHVKNGVVLLDDPLDLPDGSPVLVLRLSTEGLGDTDSGTKTLFEAMEPFMGVAEGLPEDMAMNHDHYLHGVPKK